MLYGKVSGSKTLYQMVKELVIGSLGKNQLLGPWNGAKPLY